MDKELFGETLFGASPFVKWTISPCLVIFIVSVPALLERWDLLPLVIMGGLELICLCLLAGLWLPARSGRLAFRALCLLVFLAYAGYLGWEFMHDAGNDAMRTRRSESSPLNATLGLISIGLPCLWYAIMGRFRKSPLDKKQEFAAKQETKDLDSFRPGI